MKKEWIEVASQIGGEDAFFVLQPHLRSLKGAFAKAAEPISRKVDQLTFILRVDGAVRVWNLPAVSNLDLNLKDRYISIDIAIPASEWQKPPVELASYIATTFTTALPTVLDALQKSDAGIAPQRVTLTVNEALSKYQHMVRGWPNSDKALACTST